MIIFGWGRRTRKDEGQSRTYTCPNCRNTNRFRLMTVRTWFSLFFIPLIPYSTQRYELCPVCNRGRNVTKAEMEQFKTEAASDQAYITGSPIVPPPVLDVTLPGTAGTTPEIGDR